MNNHPQITPEREAELCRWAAEFAKYVLDDGWADPDEWEWIHSINDNHLKGHLAFTRSLDAARELLTTLWGGDFKTIHAFVGHLVEMDKEDFPNKWNNDADEMMDEMAAALFAMMLWGLAMSPLQICLAAYEAVTGQPFEIDSASGAEGIGGGE